MHKNVRHSLPPSKYTHNRCPYLSPTPPPKNKSLAHQYTPTAAITLLLYIIITTVCRYCSLTLSRTFATTKAGSDTSDAQILTFIIYTIFNKIYFFFANVVFRILATQKYFLWVLTMPGYGLSQHPKTQQSHLTDFHNMWF